MMSCCDVNYCKTSLVASIISLNPRDYLPQPLDHHHVRVPIRRRATNTKGRQAKLASSLVASSQAATALLFLLGERVNTMYDVRFLHDLTPLSQQHRTLADLPKEQMRVMHRGAKSSQHVVMMKLRTCVANALKSRHYLTDERIMFHCLWSMFAPYSPSFAHLRTGAPSLTGLFNNARSCRSVLEPSTFF